FRSVQKPRALVFGYLQTTVLTRRRSMRNVAIGTLALGIATLGLAATAAAQTPPWHDSVYSHYVATGGSRSPALAPEDDPYSTVDSDGDGYTDYEEKHNPIFNNPQADFHTPGVFKADIHKPDIFIEVAFMGPKHVQVPYFWTPWHGWYYADVQVEGAHRLSSNDANAMLAR